MGEGSWKREEKTNLNFLFLILNSRLSLEKQSLRPSHLNSVQQKQFGHGFSRINTDKAQPF